MQGDGTLTRAKSHEEPRRRRTALRVPGRVGDLQADDQRRRGAHGRQDVDPGELPGGGRAGEQPDEQGAEARDELAGGDDAAAGVPDAERQPAGRDDRGAADGAQGGAEEERGQAAVPEAADDGGPEVVDGGGDELREEPAAHEQPELEVEGQLCDCRAARRLG